MDSILTSVKKALGIHHECVDFDDVLIMHINSVFVTLFQIGVGSNPFSISDSSDKWDDFLMGDSRLEMIKSYMYLKVRVIFDPPQNSSLLESINRQISEYEWRISVTVDPGR